LDFAVDLDYLAEQLAHHLIYDDLIALIQTIDDKVADLEFSGLLIQFADELRAECAAALNGDEE
jgi:hypothetical protein